MADRKLIVEIVGDDTSLQRSLKESSAAIKDFGNKTQRAGSGSTVSARATVQPTLDSLRKNIEEAEVLQERLQTHADKQAETLNKIATAAKIGAGAFVLGRTLKGAAAGLEAFNGEHSELTQSLGDAGEAIESLVTLDIEGFFKSVGGVGKRADAKFEAALASLKDANQAQDALKIAAVASATGNEKIAAAIRDQVAGIKAAKTAQEALDFSRRELNDAVIAGERALVKFRGAGAAEDIRGGLRGPGGIAIDRASRNPGLGAVNVKVELDGVPVSKNTTKQQQKTRRRNPRAKSGPNSTLR